VVGAGEWEERKRRGEEKARETGGEKAKSGVRIREGGGGEGGAIAGGRRIKGGGMR